MKVGTYVCMQGAGHWGWLESHEWHLAGGRSPADAFAVRHRLHSCFQRHAGHPQPVDAPRCMAAHDLSPPGQLVPAVQQPAAAEGVQVCEPHTDSRWGRRRLCRRIFTLCLPPPLFASQYVCGDSTAVLYLVACAFCIVYTCLNRTLR